MNLKIYQDPGNLKWFIEIDGLMDTDEGMQTFFDTEQDAIEHAKKKYKWDPRDLGLYKPTKINHGIMEEMSKFYDSPLDLEYEDGRYMLRLDTVSSGASGIHQPSEIADAFNLEIPSDAEDIQGTKTEDWDDWEWAWDEIEEKAGKYADFLNEISGSKGTLSFGHSEADGDYGLDYYWEEGDHPEWDARVKAAKKKSRSNPKSKPKKKYKVWFYDGIQWVYVSTHFSKKEAESERDRLKARYGQAEMREG